MMRVDATIEPKDGHHFTDSTERTLDDDSPGSILSQSTPSGFASTVQSGGCATLFFRCLSCCNCIFLILLTNLVLYELEQVHTLRALMDKDQETMAALQDEVREKQDFKIEELHQEVEKEHNLTLLTLAGFFTLLTCLIAMFHISSHLQRMNQPIIQRKIIAILWMSPIYSVTSFLTLLYPPIEGYMAIIKDFYESYCIYTFLSFLIVVLGRGSRESAVEVLAMRAQQLEKPTRLLSRWYDPPPETSDIAKAHAVITECQIFAMQFVFIRPLTTVIYVVYNAGVDDDEATTSSESYDSGSVHEALNDTGHRALRWLQALNATDTSLLETLVPTVAPLSTPIMSPLPTIMPVPDQDFTEATKEYFQSVGFVLTMIVNVSVFFAFMGLLKFYHSVHNDLEWCRPWPKFLTIKGVVFLTFWQGLAILILVNLSGGSDDGEGESPAERGFRYQNFLICCEMLFFSLTHWCVFPAEEWEKGYEPPTQAHKPGIGIQDFVSDVGQIYRRRRRRRAGRVPAAAKRSSPRRGDAALYHRPGMPTSFLAEEEDEMPSDGSGPRISNQRSTHRAELYHEDSSESYHPDMDLELKEEPVMLGNPQARRQNRPRVFSDGSSLKADDEDDDMELI